MYIVCNVKYVYITTSNLRNCGGPAKRKKMNIHIKRIKGIVLHVICQPTYLKFRTCSFSKVRLPIFISLFAILQTHKKKE